MAKGPMLMNREEWLRDLGDYVPMVKKDVFFEKLMPTMSVEVVAKIRQELVNEKRLASLDQPGLSSGDSLWTDFINIPSTKFKILGAKGKRTEREDVVFGRLLQLRKAIKDAGVKVLGRQAVTDYEATPTLSFKSGWNCSFKVDGYERLKESTAVQSSETKHANECDVVCLEEYKKISSPKTTHDNTSKVIGAASHCLFEDPCRRFIYGLTIEDNNAKVWLFSRAAVVVSEAFDFLKADVDYFIRFVASISFADKFTLGYDPTVERVLVAGKTQYKYNIGDCAYVTVNVLSNVRSLRVIGRATRVWCVRRWEDVDKESAEEFALKDVWVDDDARTESQIQDEIFQRFNTVNPIDMDLLTARTYFMTILKDEPVVIGTSIDKTKPVPESDCARFSLLKPVAQKLDEQMHKEESSAHVVGCVAVAPVDRPEKPPKRYRGRTHFRLLFKHVGKTLHSLRDHKKAFGALADATIGLKILYSAGYVHRDISTGNVLLCDGIGKLSDLEYARPFENLLSGQEKTSINQPSEKEVKTGTPAFMAVEVQCGKYLFRPREEDEGLDDAADFEWDDDPPSLVHPTAEEHGFFGPDNLVTHNYTHDLESLWWMANYVLLSTVPIGDWAPMFDLDVQKALFHRLFPHATGLCEVRKLLFENEKLFYKIMSRTLERSVKPSLRQLGMIRKALCFSYEKFYKNVEDYRSRRGFQSLYDVSWTQYLRSREQAVSQVRSVYTESLLGNPRRALFSMTHRNQLPVTGQKRSHDSVDDADVDDAPPAKRPSLATPGRHSEKENWTT